MKVQMWLKRSHTREASPACLLLPLSVQPQCLPLTFMPPVSLHVPSSPEQSHVGPQRNDILPSSSYYLSLLLFEPRKLDFPTITTHPDPGICPGLHPQCFWPILCLLCTVLFLSWAAVVSLQLMPDLLNHLPVFSCLGWSSHTPLTLAYHYSISHHRSQGLSPFFSLWSPSFCHTKEFCMHLGNISIPYHNPVQSCIG